MARYTDGFWWNDGLRLHYRDYAGGADGRPVLLCLPGLTRNVRDFESLAERLAPAWRVIAVSFRGRGESAFSRNPTSYVPLIYVLDLQVLIRELGLTAFVPIGTSLGGLVTMLMAEAERERIKGVVLNDVGPELNQAGIDRIRSYVGRSANWPTWLHAARALAETQRAAYPDYKIDDWLRMAKRVYRLSATGRIVLDYDTRIAEPMRSTADQPPISTVAQPGPVMMPLGPGMGPTQLGWVVGSPTRAAGRPPIVTVAEPFAIIAGPPGTQGSVQGVV